ncbi:hypothetical protein DEU56DRAFT_918963 [Suillus clintonianus]|uniref:uncharacterized protein n=1 Tax=Suillus clintonianus TaxID=1904413 RepID=UPI001B85C1FE|nr:uncharacterized protein DEU56DRAFT_918963 [Suillus clintonianus]KAG2117758.1 hypothetical protein DEU56DRAFT_918963 [Suillus clintonianus]
MTLVLNDPSLWPVINASRIYSYFAVASSIWVMYDWALTFGQEIELIWRQRWSLMTALYLSVRYLGILYAAIEILDNVTTISLTDSLVQYNDRHSCLIVFIAQYWVSIVVNAILGVFLTVTIAVGVLNIITTTDTSAEEAILSGTYECFVDIAGNIQLLAPMTWILGTIWEVLALCLAIWIAVKHFRELRRHSAGGIIGDCFTVLIQSHVVYFASFVVVSCFTISSELSPTLSGDPQSLGTQIYLGLREVFQVVQMFVLGPRLILSVREYHAKLMADSDAAIGMTSFAFQERDSDAITDEEIIDEFSPIASSSPNSHYPTEAHVAHTHALHSLPTKEQSCELFFNIFKTSVLTAHSGSIERQRKAPSTNATESFSTSFRSWAPPNVIQIGDSSHRLIVPPDDCAVMKLGGIWMTVVVNAILGVIIIARLNAMYQRSRKVLIPLVVMFLADYIAVGVVVILATRHSSGEVLVLSGTYECAIDYESDNALLFSISWILTTVWEVLALCLAVQVAVKHFCELRRHSSGWIIKDCFTVLMKTHVAYFASFVVVSGCEIGSQLSPTLSDQYSPDLVFLGFLQIFQIVQMFVLGPRLILSIREYYAKLVSDSDTATGMNSIVFQERVRVATSSSV